MRLGNPASDRQPQPVTARTSAFSTSEGQEDALQVLFRHTGAHVRDVHHGHTLP
jgi:hypothetical protein